MKKKKNKLKRRFFFLLFIIGLGFAGYYAYNNYIVDFIQRNTTVKTKNTKKETKESWPKVSKISLVATGDGLLHNSVYYDAYDESNDSFNFDKQLSLVKDIIQNYDLAYYNQETVFGGKQLELYDRFKSTAANVPGYFSFPYFNSPSEFGDAMVDTGFNLISLASNHSLDCTSKAIECINNSYDYWAKKDVVFDGFNKNESQDNEYNIGEINGIKYGFLDYTNTLNGLDRYLDGNNYLIDSYDEEKVKKEVEELKDKVDVIIVAMHWHKNSAEYQTSPTQSNKDIAKYLSSLGVDIILGTYSHCLQPFDIIDNTVVFYSLGNFISNQGVLIDSIGYKGIMGVLASMDITKKEYEDGTKDIIIDNLGADLIYTYSENKSSIPKNFKVVPFSKMTSSYESKYKELYDEYSAILTNLNNNIKIAEIGSNL